MSIWILKIYTKKKRIKRIEVEKRLIEKLYWNKISNEIGCIDVVLNPLGGQNLNKVEVSFKATLDLNNLPPVIGNKKKIKLANISEDEY